ncbi:MAG: DUF2975 domain-containing protein [Caulobacterales bacterium]|nr:DUF2975 domain-containing protein [Caulobacterales bacterium]
MKTLGRGSLAWILWTALGVLRVLVIVLAVLVTGLAVLAALEYAGAGRIAPWLTIDLADPWHVTALGFLVTGIGLAAIYIVIDRLRRIFATLSDGDPFVPENADHLRVIAVVIAVFEAARYLVGGGAALAAWLTKSGDVFTGRIDLNPSVWFAVLVIFVLAEVFREGARMRAEQQLTI